MCKERSRNFIAKSLLKLQDPAGQNPKTRQATRGDAPGPGRELQEPRLQADASTILTAKLVTKAQKLKPGTSVNM